MCPFNCIRRQSPLTLGLVFALLSLLLDQFSKNWVIIEYGLQSRFIAEVTGFFNLVLVWNRGVSFGLLANHPEYMPYLLTVIASVLVIFLSIWMWRSKSRFMAISLGLVVGGAIGNIIDRIRFGAVIDFLDFHWYGMHWPAFNVADSTIFIGVALLLVQTMIEPQAQKEMKAE